MLESHIANRRVMHSFYSNIFADILAFIAFALVIVFSTKDIISLQYFIDQTVYSLSDSAMAFLTLSG